MSTNPVGDERTWRILVPVTLVIVTAIAYSNSFKVPFLLDDIAQITQRKEITDKFSEKTLSGRRPVGDLTFHLNTPPKEEWKNPQHPVPTSFHVVNLLIHILAGLALYGVVRRTLLLPSFANPYKKTATLFGGAVALLWLVHPLQTQAITYIVQRYEALMGLFYLSTLYCSIRLWSAPERFRPFWFAGAVVACALGMGTKGVMVTAPLAVVLFDVAFLARGISNGTRLARVFAKRMPLYLCLFATISVLHVVGVTTGVLSKDRGGKRKLRGGGVAYGATVGFSSKTKWYEYAQTQPYVILRYIQLSLIPVGQSLDYKDLTVEDFTGNIPLVAATGTIVVTLVLGSLLAFLVPRRLLRGSAVPWLGFNGLLFFLILGPTSSIVPIKDLIFEHRMYLSLAPLIVIVLVGGHQLLKRHAKMVPPIAVVLAITMVLGAATYIRNSVFADSESLWSDVVAKRPDNWRAWSHLGNHYNLEGKDWDKAIAAYKKGFEVIRKEEPTNTQDAASFLANLGVVYEAHADERNSGLTQAQIHEKRLLALEQYDGAIAIREDYSVAHMNRGNILMKLNRVDEALEAYRKSLEFDRNALRPSLNYAVSLGKANRHEEALAVLIRLLRRHGENPDVHERLAKQYYRLGRQVESQQQALLARQDLSPEEKAIQNQALEAKKLEQYRLQEQTARRGVELTKVKKSAAMRGNQFHLGLALHMQKRFALAIKPYEAALAVDAGYVSARTNVANCYIQIGQPEKAIPHLDVALNREPNNANGRYLVGRALLEINRPKDALVHLRKAVELNQGMLHAQVLIADCLIRLGQYRQAEQLLKALSERHPMDREIRYTTAKLLLSTGRQARGERILEVLLEAQPNFEAARQLLEAVRSGQFRPPRGG